MSVGLRSLHDYKVLDIDGREYSFDKLKGKKVLLVNTASKCGMTPQYADLQKLYEKYKSKNLEIIAFPANNFGAQEPGNNKEIKAFCKKNYGVTFPLMSKISVKGWDQHPLYRFLSKKEINGKMNVDITWNFQKFMVDENGDLVDYLEPNEGPFDDKLINWINEKEVFKA